MKPRLAAMLLILLLPLASARGDEPIWHDDFESMAGWKVQTADGVELKLTQEPGLNGQCLRIDYDFTRGSGYGIIRHEFGVESPRILPENYRFNFALRGEGPPNTLEFKLVDESNDNVWWVNQRNIEFPKQWSRRTLQKRTFSFAWGPSGGKPIDKLGALEIVVTSFNGGKGTVWLDDLALQSLPPILPYEGTPSITVSSRADGGTGPLSINADNFLGWRSTPSNHDAEPTATIDFGQAREFGGLIIEWEDARHAANYHVDSSIDGAEWNRLVTITDSNGGRDYLTTTDAVARFIRVKTTVAHSALTGVGVRTIRVMPPSFGDSSNELMKVVAADALRGWYPKQFLGEKSYWTIMGVPGDTKEALINEEGAIEFDKLSPSIEPFITLNDRFITWNQTFNTPSLAEGYLPIPSVTRSFSSAGKPVFDLVITAFAFGEPGSSSLAIRYELKNTGALPIKGSLHLALRPFQVNPLEQALNVPGGTAILRSITLADQSVRAENILLLPLDSGTIGRDSVYATPFSQGEIVEYLAAGVLPRASEVYDQSGLVSGALSTEFHLQPRTSHRTHFVVPFHKTIPQLPASVKGSTVSQRFDELLTSNLNTWRARLSRTEIRLPAAQMPLWNSIRSNLAYILINADGPGIQPGSRSYERTWIRDGSLTSAALLAFGFEKEPVDFIDWFAPYQYENGKIPCCVDSRGPDPVPEHDSHGQYIYAVADCFRFSHDKAFLRRHWPRVVKAIDYIEFLRNQRMTAEYRDGSPDKKSLYGLMPESISHEGYSAKPMHSYWDDFFTIKGITDAEFIARSLDETGAADRFASLRQSFQSTLLDSLALAMKIKGIDYLPGCAELGDFDATSTTVALWPCGQFGHLPRPALDATFDKYMGYFRDRRDGVSGTDGARSDAYTPYEWRIVGSLVRLGRRDDAVEVLDFLMKDQRPLAADGRGWNHWAEVVWKDPATPKFIGDMPHTWVGSDFINSVRSMLAFERESDNSLVIAGGLPIDWFRSHEGISVKDLGTEHGRLTFEIATSGKTTTVNILKGVTLPKGGAVVSVPGAELIVRARINGEETAFTKQGEFRVFGLPATIELDYR